MDAEVGSGKPTIEIEIVFARPEQQALLRVAVPQGTSAREALKCSGLDKHFSELTGMAMEHAALGVFGQRLHDPDGYKVVDGDRIEVYRDLVRDPKQARIARAKSKS